MSEEKECYIPRRWWDALKDWLNSGIVLNPHCYEIEFVLEEMEKIEKGSTIQKQENENAEG